MGRFGGNNEEFCFGHMKLISEISRKGCQTGNEEGEGHLGQEPHLKSWNWMRWTKSELRRVRPGSEARWGYLTCRHLGCFHLLPPVNSATMNLSVQISL